MASRNRPPRQHAELPEHYTPIVAGYAAGPLITEPDEVRDSEWSWRSCRTYVVRWEGHDYRAVRVYAAGPRRARGEMIGYWAVELLGVPLDGLE